MIGRYEVWIRPNRRPYAIQAAVGALIILVGAAVFLVAGESSLLRFFGFVGLVLGTWMAWVNLQCCWRPRVARSSRNLLMYVHGSRPIQIPLEVVEVFFHGQSPLDVQARTPHHTEPVGLESLNIVVRLAERAVDWQQHTVSPSVAKWCGGYISLFGTQCEPITAELLTKLNAQLVQAHRELKGTSHQGDGAPSRTPVQPGAQ
jgi:hypothetical protein